MAILIVTGTPGTGKTTYAKQIAKEKEYLYVDVNAIIKEKHISAEYDHSRNCLVVDFEQLEKELSHFSDNVVIDSHFSHFLSPDKVDVCFVTKCDILELKKRLEKRGYSKSKIRENLDCEILDVCRIEALEKGHNVVVKDMTILHANKGTTPNDINLKKYKYFKNR